jgi:hypothetical protein
MVQNLVHQVMLSVSITYIAELSADGNTTELDILQMAAIGRLHLRDNRTKKFT